MGVKGLWPLLEPVGRRISIEALQNKRLAVGEWPSVPAVCACSHTATPKRPRRPTRLHRGCRRQCVTAADADASCCWLACPFADASIWLFQFIQAMRDDRGELIRNAHVLGFFRRICR